jgi:hypothetical protein
MDDLPPPTPETETVMEQLTKRRGLRDAWFWVFVALIVVLGIEVWFLTRAFYISSVITSDSMKPTLMRGRPSVGSAAPLLALRFAPPRRHRDVS